MRRLAGRRIAVSSRKFVETYVDEDELLRFESGVAWTRAAEMESRQTSANGSPLKYIEKKLRELARPPSKWVLVIARFG
jgi:hypothetical protein